MAAFDRLCSIQMNWAGNRVHALYHPLAHLAALHLGSGVPCPDGTAEVVETARQPQNFKAHVTVCEFSKLAVLEMAAAEEVTPQMFARTDSPAGQARLLTSQVFEVRRLRSPSWAGFGQADNMYCPQHWRKRVTLPATYNLQPPLGSALNARCCAAWRFLSRPS